MQYSFQNNTLLTVGQKYTDKVFQMVHGKSQNVSGNKTTPPYNAQYVGFRMFSFLPKIK